MSTSSHVWTTEILSDETRPSSLRHIRRAKKRIASGWCKGTFERDGKYCLAGALNYHLDRVKRADLENLMVSLMPFVDSDFSLSFYGNLAKFNDSRKSKEEVIELLDLTEAALIGQGA